MKILFLSDDFPPKSFGGAGVVVFNLAQAFARKGHQICVITSTQNKHEEGKTSHDGLEVHRLYSDYQERWRAYKSLCNPKTVKQIKQIIDEMRPDIVHAHNIHYYLSYRSLKVAKESGSKVFLTAHDAMLFHYGKKFDDEKVSWWSQFRKYRKRYNPFRNFIIRRYLKYVDKVFSVSHALSHALNNNGIKNVEVIHNGIDVEKWQTTNNLVTEFKNKFNLNNKKVVLFGGRLSEPKGGEKIIKMMDKVVKDVPDARLLVLGQTNDYSKEMLREAKKMGIEKNIIFTGWISGVELVAGYHVSDLVVTPSLYLDPFPTVNLEAMACGKAVIGTCFGGTKEVVKDNVTGFIVDPFDVENTADKIIELLQDPIKMEKFGRAGFERVTKEFTLEKQVQETLLYY